MEIALSLRLVDIVVVYLAQHVFAPVTDARRPVEPTPNALTRP